jgi:iron complex outermembrane recepter protein
MSHLARSVRRCLALATAATTASLYVGTAFAASNELEEVVVTAQKQEQKLSETPLSVTALSSKDLEALGATQFRDFANTVAGLGFTTSGVGATQINLRGITAGGAVSPTVGIYVDEVPYGSSTAFAGAGQLALDAGLFDLTRVEVLRGPQGTLYGASTMGGLVKYVTTVPDLHEFGGTARAGLSATDHGGTSYDVASAVNLPFASDKAAARVSGFYSHDGGYVDNIGFAHEGDVNRSDVYGGRADVLFKPTDALSIRLTAYLQDINRDGTNQVGYDLATEKPIDGSLDQSTLVPQPFDQQYRMYNGTVVYDFGPAVLTSVTSYQSMSNDSAIDGTALFAGLLNVLYGPGGPFTPPEYEIGAVGIDYGIGLNKFTQELRLAGTGPTVDWLVGGFYTDENSNQSQTMDPRAPDGSPLNFNPLTLKLPSSYEETAGFGTVTWHATSKLDLAGGLRYSHNAQSYAQNVTGGLAALIPSRSEVRSSENVTTYLANVRYLANDNLMSYFRFATGYRPGGPNFVAYNPQPPYNPLGKTSFQSDKLQSYEGGIKVSTDDRRFAADAAIYLINWDNMQVASAQNGIGVVANANTARSTGVELTLTALPVPEFSLVGTFAYINARLTAAAPDLGGKNGDALPDTPDFAATVSGDYAFDVAGHASTVGAVLRYVGSRVSGFPQGNYPNWDLPSYTTFDLRGSVAFGSANLRLYVRNLFDEKGQLSAETTLASAGGPAMISILQPRTYGMSVDVNF